MYKGLVPISVLIVEDDLSFALELEMLVLEIGYHVVGVAESSAAALDIIYSEQVDFILMDINIKGLLTGLELGKKIIPLKIPILFITSFGNESYQDASLMSNFVGYLVKPIDKISLITTISLAIRHLSTNAAETKPGQSAEEFLHGEYLFLKKNHVYHKVAECEIALVEGERDYVSIHLTDGRKFLLRKSMQIMEDMLSSTMFLRIHRSYLVNVTAIDRLDTHENLLIIGGTTIPLGRQRRLDLERLIRKMD